MECAQAQPASAVSHDATDGSAAAAQQVEDGDSGGRPPAIDQVALAFMENMKLRFGDQSHESATIHDTTGKFSRGEISKRETFSIISDTIGGHDDLRHDLLAILNHGDARWGPGDFDPYQQPVPQFLQPAHQPQMRLPSMSVPWESSSRAYPPLNPVTYSADNTHARFEHKDGQDSADAQCRNEFEPHAESAFLSSYGPSPSNELVTTQLVTPGPGSMIDAPTIPNFDYGFVPNQPNVDPSIMWRPQQSQYLNSWTGVDYGNTWAADRQLPYDGYYRSVDETQSPTTHYAMRSLDTVYPTQLPDTVLAPFLHPERAEPQMPSSLRGSSELSPGRIAVGDPAEMPPPSRKRHRRLSSPDGELEEPGVTLEPDHGFTKMKSENEMAPKRRSRSTKSENVVDRSRTEGSGAFIHGLCGKRFATRSKVKKHHWGIRYDDLDTDTGCWAKHNKPNVSWDDHPSCKVELKSRVAKEISAPPRSRQRTDDSGSTEYKAPVVPAMVPTYDAAPLELPVQQNHTREPLETFDSPQTLVQDAKGGFLPYHTHGLPARSSFESLLSAVNVASKMEAPVPQGRNDSLVCRLDAQAVAAERESHYLPAWAFSSVRPEDEYVYGDQLPASGPVYPAGWAMPLHAPASSEDRRYPSLVDRYGRSSAAVSPTMSPEHSRHHAASAEVIEGMARIDPNLYSREYRESMQSSVSPGPERKKYRL